MAENNKTDTETEISQKSVEVEDNKIPEEEESGLGGPRFCPALYIQRYGFITQLLDKHHISSVVDFGCAECKILTLIKTVKSLQKIVLVDIDEKLLQSHQYFIRPNLDDYLHRRENPLTVQLLAGSAAIFDKRIVGIEAVTLVEVIEHLTPEILGDVADNIFNNIRPKFVIMTTPNSDFNVLFPNFTGFRHWDHKFEWSRGQFNAWCHKYCFKYGYKVEMTGIGDAPDDSRHVGYCSQAAIFKKLNIVDEVEIEADLAYKEISVCHYPYKEVKLTIEEQLGNEVYYYIRQQCLQAMNDQDNDCLSISIVDLCNDRNIHNLCDSQTVRNYIEKVHTVSSDGSFIEINLHTYFNTDDEGDNNDDDNDVDDDNNVEDALGYDNPDNKTETLYNEEDWV